MGELFFGYYAYGFTMILLCAGLYGILFKKNLVKKTIGLAIFQSAVILFYVSVASKFNATVPVKDPSIPLEQAELYLNPLPHTLMLTAIVVGVATLGVAFTLMIGIYNRYQTLDEQELLDKLS
ncbi:MAG: NADH-quinone oxidoreductase subunit J [Bacteroidetes bacterium]|jgi:multicomponent Na+:H+ antiporter subunit C|nr:NADH-quinone oxidoreductase subunit J [Bacteroidota bacterium]PTM15466.1 MAG: NADH-quinone oxidoreductase subunit J [Bacteroidota bacterium]PTM20494.1 MAG: NADH-quinone oxidoreductase subunit J [Bacteroidota bacterium]